MIYNVYSVRDDLVGFTQVLLEQSDQVAVRNFSSSVLTATSLYTTHPDDFTLCRVGQFDSETGVLNPLSAPESLISAGSVLRKEHSHVQN